MVWTILRVQSSTKRHRQDGGEGSDNVSFAYTPERCTAPAQRRVWLMLPASHGCASVNCCSRQCTSRLAYALGTSQAYSVSNQACHNACCQFCSMQPLAPTCGQHAEMLVVTTVRRHSVASFSQHQRTKAQSWQQCTGHAGKQGGTEGAARSETSCDSSTGVRLHVCAHSGVSIIGFDGQRQWFQHVELIF